MGFLMDYNTIQKYLVCNERGIRIGKMAPSKSSIKWIPTILLYSRERAASYSLELAKRGSVLRLRLVRASD